jgi:hypothetical protein
MSEDQLNASVDAEGASYLDEDVELTDEELGAVAGGTGTNNTVDPRINSLVPLSP